MRATTWTAGYATPAKCPVLIVGNFLSGANANVGFCETLAHRLASSGWSVLTTSACPSRPVRLADMLRTVWRERHRYAVAQVDVYSGPAFLWAELVCLALRRIGKPYVLTLHGGNLPAFAARWPRRVRHLLGSAAVVTTPSGYLLERMAPHRRDLRLQPNPIDIGSYPFRLRRRPRPRIVWLRAFHALYNPTLAVETIRLLRSHFPDIQLTMAGPDKGDGALTEVGEAVDRHRLRQCVAISGLVPKSDVPAWLDEGDIFLNTTTVDNTPISVLEAMASGLCVVSTSVGGIPHLLRHDHDALLVPSGDAPAMADAVRRVLSESGLAERLSSNARRKVERFDWSAILPRWEQFLSTAAAGSDHA